MGGRMRVRNHDQSELRTVGGYEGEGCGGR